MLPPELPAIEALLSAGRLGFDFYMDERIIVGRTELHVSGLGDVRVGKREGNGVDEPDGGSIDLILQITDRHGEDRYYRKEGYVDSYGDTEWHHGFTEVYPKTKTITYFD